jgi:NADH-quinone oxidoreductase subunit L
MVDLLWLAPAFPLAGAVLMLFIGRRLPQSAVGMLCSATVLASFVVCVSAIITLAGGTHERELLPWLPLGGANWGYLLDPLSALMVMVVTGVGFLIHVYSIGYMAGDPGYYRFFGYLNLFIFFMLILVMANNYVLMFAGWEGVGLCSYLLIGYYFKKRSATNAANKAFIVNRIGDAGFLLGVLFVLTQTGSVRFTAVTRALQNHPVESGFGVFTLTALLLFMGAAGKSAQFPLHVWLPDAMEGPTPVSALIHAATMVTAGVYMVARSQALFHLAPHALAIIAIIGALTAILAASIALVQTDIKRVLAYSTVSQLGFMFMALGVGAYWVAVFHLFTHAFFKALLFLGAGSVIHGLAGEQDMRKMGGLRHHMPLTHATMLIGALAIAGIPGLAGFFSKEEILLHAYSSRLGSTAIYGVGLTTALMTAYYMWRLMRMTFYGEPRTEVHAHESPLVMTLPLVILAAGAVLAGWPRHTFEHWLESTLQSEGVEPVTGSVAYTLMGLAIAAAFAGIYLARHAITGRLQTLLTNRFYIDEIYDALFVKGFAQRGGAALGRFDNQVVDGGVNGTAWLTVVNSNIAIFWDRWVIDGLVRLSSQLVLISSYPTRLLQTGQVQSYALVVLLGFLLVFGIYMRRS